MATLDSPQFRAALAQFVAQARRERDAEVERGQANGAGRQRTKALAEAIRAAAVLRAAVEGDPDVRDCFAMIAPRDDFDAVCASIARVADAARLAQPRAAKYPRRLRQTALLHLALRTIMFADRLGIARPSRYGDDPMVRLVHEAAQSAGIVVGLDAVRKKVGDALDMLTE